MLPGEIACLRCAALQERRGSAVGAVRSVLQLQCHTRRRSRERRWYPNDLVRVLVYTLCGSSSQPDTINSYLLHVHILCDVCALAPILSTTRPTSTTYVLPGAPASHILVVARISGRQGDSLREFLIEPQRLSPPLVLSRLHALRRSHLLQRVRSRARTSSPRRVPTRKHTLSTRSSSPMCALSGPHALSDACTLLRTHSFAFILPDAYVLLDDCALRPTSLSPVLADAL